MFNSEHEFLTIIAKHDQLVRDCANGLCSFADFTREYNNFYFYYALDGHESDENELAMFDKYENRIAPHEELANQILGPLCSDEDASREIYKDADRFGSEEALKRLKILNEKYFG